MDPVKFKEANIVFGPPSDLEESQCMKMHGFIGQVSGGSCDGLPMSIVAWRPGKEELDDLKKGGAIYLSVIGGLPPHFLTTSFEQAVSVA